MRVVRVGRRKAHRAQVMKRRRGNVFPDANVAVVAALDDRNIQTLSCQGARRGKARRPSSDNEDRRLAIRTRH